MAGITVSGVTIDSAEPEKLAAWWAEALGWQLDGACCRAPGGGLQRVEFMAVPEAKRVKNWVHIDFGANDVPGRDRSPGGHGRHDRLGGGLPARARVPQPCAPGSGGQRILRRRTSDERVT